MMFWVVFCLTQSLIQHPHWSVCRSAANTLASLSLSVFFVWQLKTCLPVRVRLTDCLTSSFSLCYEVLAEFLLSLSHRTVWCCLPVIHLLASPSSSSSFLLQQHCVSGRQCSSACEYLCVSPLCSLCLPVYPLIRPSGAGWTVEMRSVPKTAWVFLPVLTNPYSPSLTDFPLTGWSLHRWLTDTNTCLHSQKSCQPAPPKTMIMIIIITAAWSSKWFANWFWTF